MNPLDAREAEETYEYPARPYTLPMRPVQSFRVLSTSGDTGGYLDAELAEDQAMQDLEWRRRMDEFIHRHDEDAWSDKYLTAEDARVLRQDGM